MPMTQSLALSTELAALTTRVASLEARTLALETKVTKDEIILAANTAAILALTPTPIVVPPPVVDPQVQWKADMETGTLSSWDEEVNSGTANTDVVTPASAGIPSMGGTYVMRQAVTGVGGTRMQRYPEVDRLSRAGTKYYWSWWDYCPSTIAFSSSQMWQIWGMLSVQSTALNAASDVFFSLGFHPTGNTLDLTYNPTSRTSIAPKVVYSSNTPVPVGQWNLFEVEMLPRGDKTGSIQIWMNGTLLFSLFNIQTQYPSIGQTPLLSIIEQTGYGDVSFTHYVDDITLSLGKMS